jgi:hypothetical protein
VIIISYQKENTINKKVFIPLFILMIGILGVSLYFAGVFDFLLPAPDEPTPELREMDSVDLSFSKWTHPSQTGYANFQVNPALSGSHGTEITQLYDTSVSFRAKGTLGFVEIDIGKMKLMMGLYAISYNGGCNIFFRSDGDTIFGITRGSGGMWMFYDGITYTNLFLATAGIDAWYIDWEIEDDTMFISITVDSTSYIDNQEILLSGAIDEIMMITSTSESRSWTIFAFENSYLKSYEYI